MATLSERQQFFVVASLACFRRPSQVAEALKDRFGVDASLQQIEYYDPTKAHSKQGLAAKWRTLFWETRKRYTEGAAEVAAAHQRYRLERIQRLLDDPTLRKNPKLVLDALEQAAKERGGMFVNHRLGAADRAPDPDTIAEEIRNAVLDMDDTIGAEAEG